MRKVLFTVVLAAVALLGITGESSARPMHGGFRGGGLRPGFHGRFDPRFNRGFFHPGFNRFDRFEDRFERRFNHGFFAPRFERRFFDPRFGGFSAP
jgi:hypothetical protein